MGVRRMGWVCSIGLSSAFPLHTRQTSTSNSHSAKIIAPVVVVAVVCAMLVGFGWWKRRKRTQDLIQQLQTPAANTNNTNNATTTTQTTPSTGADAPARPPRRRRRRRPSQISTKSLPAYNEQAGDEEIVLVRRTERNAEDESDDDDSNENENNGRSAQASSSHAPDSRPLLDDDSSPDMPRVSLASSTHGQSLSDPQTEPPEQQSRAQSQLGHESIANTTTVASSIADTEIEPAAAHPHGEVPSYTEAVSTSHVNLPSTTEHSAQPSGSTATDDGPPPADANATVRPKRKSVFRHLGRFNISKPSGSSTPTPEAVEMNTPSRTSTSEPRPSISISGHRPSGSTSTHRPSTSLSTTNQHKPSPSLSSLSLILTRSQSPTMSRTSLNISAPIPSSLVRTELSYPRAGPTPEQIRFLSSRESLGRFGMPYGEEAIAAAKSREHLPLPPIYKPRGGESTGATGGGSAGTGTSAGAGTGTGTTQEDEPTITIRRGPILLTPGELAQRKKSESAASDSTETDRPDSDPVLDPAMTITEEPIAVQGSATIEEDSKSVQEEPVTGQERTTIQEEGEAIAVVEEPLAIQSRDEEIRVEPGYRARVRESPYDMNDGRRESVMTTNSFVTATEGQGDSSPPTPTAETYHQSQTHVLTGAQAQSESTSQAPDRTLSQSQVPARTEQVQVPARAQTVLIPQSRDALHPELTLVPATPIG